MALSNGLTQTAAPSLDVTCNWETVYKMVNDDRYDGNNGANKSLTTSGLSIHIKFNKTKAKAAGYNQYAIIIYGMKVYVDGNELCSFKFSGGDIFWATYNYLNIDTQVSSRNKEYDIPLYQTTKLLDGNPYWYANSDSQKTLRFTNSGYKTVRIEFDCQDSWSGGTRRTEVYTFTNKICFAPFTLNSIATNTSNAKVGYYKNENFSNSNLVVNATYHDYWNNYAFQSSVNGWSTNPSNGTKLTQAGTNQITVSYGGKTSTYNISVYGVKNYTKPTIKSVRSTDYFRVGEAGTIAQATITYDNNATTSATVSHNFNGNSSGSKTISYSVVASNTQETLTWTSNVTIFDLTSITLGGTPTKAFNFNETFSTSGLTVTSHFGANNEAGSESVSLSNCTIGTLPMSVGEHDISVSYKYTPSGTTKTTSYKVIRKGILDFDVEIPDDKKRIAKNGVFTKTGCTPKVKRLGYANGQKTIDEVWQSYSGSWEISSPLDTTQVGNQQVTFKATENGQDIYVTKTIMVYGHERLEVSGISSPIQIYVDNQTSVKKLNETDIPSLANLVVKAITNDNQKITLTRGAVNDGYRLNPAYGSNLSFGMNTIEIIDSSDESIRATFKINVQENQIDFDNIASVVVNGFIAPYSEVGIPIDMSNVHVYAPMLDGTTKDVSFQANIEDKEGLTFSSEDTIGDRYDVEIYIIEDSETKHLVGTFSTTLNGISSISNVTATKGTTNATAYEVGEQFDPSTVEYDINFVNGDVEHHKVKEDSSNPITDERTTVFAYSEAGDNSGVGSLTLSFKIKGFSVSLGVKVKKLISLEFVVPNNTSFVYQIGDRLDLAAKNVGIKKVYNNTQKVDISEDDDVFFAFTDGSGNEIASCQVNNLIPEATRMSATVKAYANLDIYGGNYEIVTTTPLTLTVKAIREVKLLDEDLEAITQIVVNNGEKLEDYLIGKYLQVKLNDGNNLTAQEIHSDYSGCSVDLKAPIVSHTSISGTCAYTYGSDTQYASFTIHNHYLDDVDTNIDEVLEEDYYVGDELDLDELEVTKTIASTDTDDEDYPEESEVPFGSNGYTLAVNGQIINKDGYVFSNAGTYVLTISYQGITITRNITVTAVVLTEIEPVLSNAFKSFANYYDDQYLTLEGLSVNLKYNNGYVRNISYVLVDIVDEDGVAFNKTQQLDNTHHNGKKLYVSYNENGSLLEPVLIPSNSGTLVVTPKALTSISIEVQPNKTTYTYGDKFSLYGMLVKANFNNGNSESINVNDLSISGATIGHEYNPTNDATFGNITVTISYTYGGVTQTTTLTITLVKPQISYLMTNASTDAVRKNFQDGDTFSTTGLVVTAVMTNGWTCNVASFTTNASTVLNLDNSSKIQLTGDYGAKEITISGTNPYDSGDATTVKYTVDIETSGAIVSAILMLDPESDYKNYFVGDKYNAKGVSWRVTDIDGKVFTSGVFTTSIQIGTTLRAAQRIEVQVTYSNGSFTKTDTYEIIVSVAQLATLTETRKYKIAVGNSSGSLYTEITHEEATIKLGKQYDESGNLVGEYYPIFPSDLVRVDDSLLTTHELTHGFNIYIGSDFENDCIGYMDMGLTTEDGTVVRKAHVILFEDPLNPIDGDGNIEVKFPHYVSGYADKINKCRFGVVYNNRLFVSGNPNFKNCDWHSGDVNVSQVDEYNNKAIKDYTYFSDLDYCYYGDADTAIVGYDIYRDGDLIVVKEGSKHQATLYRRSMKLISATSADGNSVSEDGSLAEPSFPMFDINSNGGVGGLSHRGVVNFVGETIVLTKNGLKALTNKDDVYNTAKYTFDVSSFINEKIKEEDLKNAFLYVFEETLLLKTKRGVYVGFYGLRNDDNEYEWYFLSNIDASIFFECDEELYFANDNGEICRFPVTKKDYKDKTRTFVGVGGATLYIDSVNDTLVASAAYKDEVKEGRPFHLLTSYTVNGEDRTTQIYANLGSFVNKFHKQNVINNGGSFDQTAYVGLMDTTNNTIELKCFKANGDEDTTKLLAIQDLFYEGREVYLDHFVGDVYTLFTYRRYFLKKYNENVSNVYQLVDNYGNVMSLLGINTVRMSFLVNDLAITHITDVSDYGSSGAKQFSLLGDHDKKLDLIYYNDEVGSYSGVITKEENVNAFFVTAPYSMGAITLTKTILQWVVANDTQLASLMDIGYFSSRKQGDYEMVVKSTFGTRQLNFNGWNFDKIQFTNDKLPHVYSKHRTVPNVNFIRFLFKNDEDSNLVLTTLNIVYTIAQFTKGVN